MAEKEFAGAEGRAMALLRLLSEDRLQVLGPDGEGRYALQANGADLPEGAEALLEALERAESLRVPGERLEKDLRRFLKGGDLTGGGLLLLASRRLFLIREEAPDAYAISMDRRFQETVPKPEVRLEHLIAALRAWEGRRGLFRARVLRVYRAVDLPALLLEEVRTPPLTAAEARGLPVEGKVFVLAGGFRKEDRARARALIAAQGGRCAASLSGRTDYLAAGTPETLRANTLLQFQALRDKGRDVYLLDPASLFALLGEETPVEPAAPAPVPEAAPAEPEPVPETVPAAPAPGSGPVQEASVRDASLFPELSELLHGRSPAPAERDWDALWASSMASTQAEAAIAEKTDQVQRLRKAQAAEEQRLQHLGLLKFAERAASRQTIQRLGQALRTAEAELARLTAGAASGD